MHALSVHAVLSRLCRRRFTCFLLAQSAMTVRWSHWLLGHAAAWQRDDQRLRELMPRVATLPLGSGTPSACLSGIG